MIHQLPEVSFQLFLFNQRGHNGSNQKLVGNSANQEVAKDTDESNPSSAEKKNDANKPNFEQEKIPLLRKT